MLKRGRGGGGGAQFWGREGGFKYSPDWLIRYQKARKKQSDPREVDTVNVDIFTHVNFHAFLKTGNFVGIKICVFSTSVS